MSDQPLWYQRALARQRYWGIPIHRPLHTQTPADVDGDVSDPERAPSEMPTYGHRRSTLITVGETIPDGCSDPWCVGGSRSRRAKTFGEEALTMGLWLMIREGLCHDHY